MVEARRLGDRYVLGEQIAAGGMGRVYLGTDERLGRRVAIKLLKDDLAEDPTFIERFRREARALANLSHPNIAAVYDYGEDGSRSYIVMEYAEGRDLARILREEGPLDSGRAAYIAAQVAGALARAHAEGIIHRDVKPANVIVSDTDQARVTDFGIARTMGDSTLTATGSVLGTAQYWSPEQAAGTEIGPQSDIYSAGVVLYEMLTGAVPFTGESAVAVALRHLNEDVPPPSRMNPTVPPDLDAIVARATAREVSDRYQTGAEMALALDGARTGHLEVPESAAVTERIDAPQTARLETPAPARADGPVVPESIRRNALKVLGALAALAVVLLLFRLATGGDDDEPRQRNGATAQRVEIPDLRGAEFPAARAALADAGLKSRLRTVESDEELGTVVRLKPRQGSRVRVESTVTLIVSADIEDEVTDDPSDAGDSAGPDEGKGEDKGKGKAKGHDKKGKKKK